MPYKITITEFHKSLLNTLFKWSNTIEIRFNIKTRERITTNIMDFSSPAKYCIRKNPKENPKSRFYNISCHPTTFISNKPSISSMVIPRYSNSNLRISNSSFEGSDILVP